MNLAKQIVLKPEHDFFMIGKAREPVMLFAQLSPAVFDWHVISFRKVFRAHVHELRLRKVSRCRTGHQRLAPGDVFAGNVSAPRCAGRGIAVVNVKHGAPDLQNENGDQHSITSFQNRLWTKTVATNTRDWTIRSHTIGARLRSDRSCGGWNA